MFGIGTQEILFIALIVLLFFGGKKIPEMMRGIGKGVRSFKEGMKGIDVNTDATPQQANQHEATDSHKA